MLDLSLIYKKDFIHIKFLKEIIIKNITNF